MDNKEELVAFFNFVIVLCALIFVTYLLYTDIKPSSNKQFTNLSPEPVSSSKIIATEEVEFERLKFIKSESSAVVVSENDYAKDVVLNATPPEQYKNSEISSVVEEKPTAEITAQEIKNQYGETLVAVPVTVNDVSSSKPKNDSSSMVYVRPDSGISLNSVTVSTGEGDSREVIAQVVNGTIISIDKASKSLTISEAGMSPVRIKTDINTIFVINNKNLTFSDFKISDIVRAEGHGYQNSNEIIASIVAITGVYQIIPTD